MNEDMKKELMEIVKGILKHSGDTTVDLEAQAETRLKALSLVYRESKKIRGFIDVCMTMYTRAVIEEKDDILIDGMVKLYEMIFDVEPMESKATVPQEK